MASYLFGLSLRLSAIVFFLSIYAYAFGHARCLLPATEDLVTDVVDCVVWNLANDKSLEFGLPVISKDQHFSSKYHDLKRDSDSIAWATYAPKGQQYYQQWQQRSGLDLPIPCDFDQEFDVVTPFLSEPNEAVVPVLEDDGYQVGPTYIFIQATGPRKAPTEDTPRATFELAIDPSEGIIIANAMDRGIRPSDPNDLAYNDAFPFGQEAATTWHFSTVAWAAWRRSVMWALPNQIVRISDVDLSSIRSFWVQDITNEWTLQILFEIYEGRNPWETLTWTPSDTDADTNPFWALLGWRNGNFAIHVLTDYKIALRGQGIVSIKTAGVLIDAPYHPEGERWVWHMWLNVG